MPHIAHFQEIIGIIEDGLIVLLVKKWSMDTIIRIITISVGVIPIINGIVLKAK